MTAAQRTPTQAQTCPQCDGSCTPASVQIGGWISVVQAGVPIGLERRVTFTCEHCGHQDSRTESRSYPADLRG